MALKYTSLCFFRLEFKMGCWEGALTLQHSNRHAAIGWEEQKNSELEKNKFSLRLKDKKWHFGCPFAWLLESPTGSNDNDAWPQLLFEVVSLDSWNRYRVEGYGYLNIPILATSAFTTVVHTWRPVGNGIISQLRRFFIGGCPELDNLSYISIPSDFQVCG
jgi:hypothetical protein